MMSGQKGLLLSSMHFVLLVVFRFGIIVFLCDEPCSKNICQTRMLQGLQDNLRVVVSPPYEWRGPLSKNNRALRGLRVYCLTVTRGPPCPIATPTPAYASALPTHAWRD